MAAPGVGVGDLVKACVLIYDLCVKYKDAPKEFDEIAEKSKSTEVVLERLDKEALLKGNLVERAGPQAHGQLQDNLKSLRRDLEKLQALVSKYDKIHSEGPGRRLLFALRESNGLVDLRRRIGHHEQTLQLWYMTLVYGSLRRIEGGQEEAARQLGNIMSGIDAIKHMGRHRSERVRESLAKGDTAPLETELSRSGLSPEEVMSSVNATANYMMFTPPQQRRMETDILEDLEEISKESKVGAAQFDSMAASHRRRFKETPAYDKFTPPKPPGGRVHISPPLSSPLNPPPPFSPMESRMRYDTPEKHTMRFNETALPYLYEPSTVRPVIRQNPPRMRRSNSTSARKDYPESPVIVLDESSSSRKKEHRYMPVQPPTPSHGKHVRIRSGYPSMHQKEEVIIVPNDSSSSRRARRSSEAPASGKAPATDPRSPRQPLLVVPDPGPQYRSSSAQGRDDDRRAAVEEIIVERRVSRPRASSSSSDRGERDRHERSSSTHSYVRRRSNSQEGAKAAPPNDDTEGIRMVRKMDRIDSMGT